MNRKLLLPAAALLAAISGALIFLFAPRTPPAPAKPTPPKTSSHPTTTPAPLLAATPRPVPPTPHPPSAPTPRPDREPWEYRLDEILTGTASESQTAQLLLNLLPALPEEGQVEAVSHAMNLLPDEDFQKAIPYLANPNLPEPVLSILMTDMMNRPDPVKLRGWVEIGKMPTHPLREEAIGALQIYLDEDYGEDWTRWASGVEAYIAREAAEGQ